MPPKKKGRQPSRATSTPSGDVVEHPPEEQQTPLKLDVAKLAIIPDSWTDEQETSLFKGMIRWKPVGPFSNIYWVAQLLLVRPVGFIVLTGRLHRHAQTFSNDCNLPAPPKSRIHHTARRPYTYTVHMGKAKKSLQPRGFGREGSRGFRSENF